MEVTVICFWVFFCFLIAWWAAEWARSPVAYFFLINSALCGPLVGALVLAVHGKAEAVKVAEARILAKEIANAQSSQPANVKFCSACGRPLPLDATSCPYCHAQVIS